MLGNASAALRAIASSVACFGTMASGYMRTLQLRRVAAARRGGIARDRRAPRTTCALPWNAFGGRGKDEPVFVVVCPTSFEETPQAVRALQEGANVVLNLTKLETCA